jgi:S-formylglutathione hydrolase FrmB
MALCQVCFFAQTIRKASQMTVILPDGGPGPFPVFYLLHGLSDDHTIWLRRTSIERYVAGLPLIVVMPDGDRGFYSDAVAGRPYERYLVEDVLGFVDRVFPTVARRQGRAIGGLSMGGYGALKLALKFPERFGSATSHSGCLDVAGRNWGDNADELRRIFGRRPAGGTDDLFALARRLKRRNRPALRIDCGAEDYLLDDNRRFHAHLEGLKIPHEYREFPGAHTWDYWDLQVREALAFHCRAMRIATPAGCA